MGVHLMDGVDSINASPSKLQKKKNPFEPLIGENFFMDGVDFTNVSPLESLHRNTIQVTYRRIFLYQYIYVNMVLNEFIFTLVLNAAK
jgi:hypothetical protein